MSYDLKPLIPAYYYDNDGVLSKEMDKLTDAEAFLINGTLSDATTAFTNNQYITTLTDEGIAAYEGLLNIVADPSTEDTDFRRQRLLNRLSSTAPYTMPYLRNRLDTIIGKGRYTAAVDYNAYRLTVEASAVSQSWTKEINITINRIKPANMVLMIKPLIADSIKISEEITGTKLDYNYKAGTSARASTTTPIASIHSIGTLKGGDVLSIQTDFLNAIAVDIVEDVTKALINNTFAITTFTNKTAIDNIATIEYVVPLSAGIGVITNVKLLDNSDNVLTDANVFVDVITDITLKHVIPAKEGV